MKTIIKKLKKLNACDVALEWLETQPDPQTAWDNCHNGVWMAWVLLRNSTLDNYTEIKKAVYDISISIEKTADIVREYHPTVPNLK